MSGPNYVLEARGLCFEYRRGEPVLRGVSLSAAAGRLTTVLGPNGSGKTTLLKCLLGWLNPAEGEILLDGKPLASYSQKAAARLLAYVPQTPASAFAFPVRELVLMGRFAHAGALGLAGRQDLEVARAAMEMTGTAEFAGRTLEELSGGEAQRVMIARALAQQPSVMLLDEPTSHLDIRNQLRIYDMMGRLAHEWGMAVVCVSHDVNLAARFADEMVFMRGGRVIAAGRPARVIREDILERVYAVEVKLVPAEGKPVPLVVAEQEASAKGSSGTPM
jgi:ABC-type cobalamin/Fe3+-siderophores transport system ATPase subunit